MWKGATVHRTGTPRRARRRPDGGTCRLGRWQKSATFESSSESHISTAGHHARHAMGQGEVSRQIILNASKSRAAPTTRHATVGHATPLTRRQAKPEAEPPDPIDQHADQHAESQQQHKSRGREPPVKTR